MLKKLLKYDLKYLFNTIFPLYLFTISTAIIYKIVATLGETILIFNITANFIQLLVFFLIAATLVCTSLSTIYHFYKNILKDEGYLTNTLPVSKKTIVLSKLISSILLIILSIVISIGCILFAFKTGLTLDMLAEKTPFEVSGYTLVLLGAICFIIQTISLQISFYMALSLGHVHSQNKILYSLAYEGVIYFIIQVISFVVVFCVLFLNFGTAFAQHLDNDAIANTSFIPQLLIATCISYAVLSIIGYLLTTNTLENKLNLE